jgi:hypothetical protein
VGATIIETCRGFEHPSPVKKVRSATPPTGLPSRLTAAPTSGFEPPALLGNLSASYPSATPATARSTPTTVRRIAFLTDGGIGL